MKPETFPRTKREAHKRRLLRLLMDGREHSQHEMVEAGGLRYSARLMELRREGHRIDTIRKGDDRFVYQWTPVAGQIRLL